MQKTKKMTKQEQEQTLIDWVEEFESKTLTAYQGFPVIHAQDFVHNNIKMVKYHCTACGHEWDETLGRNTQKPRCPHCRQKHSDYWSPIITHFEEYENGWYAIRYQYEQRHAQKHDDNVFAWMSEPSTYHLTAYSALRYEKGNDIVMYIDCREKPYFYSNYRESVNATFRRNTKQFDEALKFYQKCEENKSEAHIWKAIQDGLQEIENVKAAAKAKRAPSKMEITAQKQLEYQPLADGLDKAKKAFVAFPMALMSQYGRNSKFAIMCSHCGHVEKINAVTAEEARTAFAGENLICPKCGKQAVNNHLYSYHPQLSANAILFLYENTTLPDEDLLLRLFNAEAALSMVPGKDGLVVPTLSVKVKETVRFFFGTKISKYTWDDSENAWEKDRCDFRSYANRYYSSDTNLCVNSNEELLEIIKNSRLRYSGLKEAIGTDKRYRCITTPTDLSYLAAWYQNPSIEHVYKSQLYALTNELIAGNTRSEFKLNKGDDIYTALDCTPMELKIARKCNLSSYDFESMKRYCRNDPTITPEGYKTLTEKVNMSNAAGIAAFNIRWREIIEYVDTVLMHQCIAPNETMSVWLDYLNMARDVGYNLRERARRFPSSLKKEHDIAMFAHRSLKAAIDAKNFAKNAEKNAELYEYSYEDLFVMIPKTVEQVVEEATNQHNCLASYVNRLVNGDTCVAFIRYKETPESSYVTCEIRDGALVQIKGFSNSNPRTPELSTFITKWCKAKKLVVRHW